AVSVPPSCVCLRTLSRWAAQRAPLSRDVNHRGPFACEFPGRLLLRRRKDRSLPRQFRCALIFDLALSFLIAAFRHRDLRVRRLSRRKVSSKWRADATIEYADRLAAIPRQHLSTRGLCA